MPVAMNHLVNPAPHPHKLTIRRREGEKKRVTQQSTGTVSLIPSVTFKREEGDRARLVLIMAVWLQVRVRPGPIVAPDRMASVNTF